MENPQQQVDFSTALDAMKDGCKVTRPEYKGKIYIEEGRILVEVGNIWGIYVVTEEDILANDWEILENTNG